MRVCILGRVIAAITLTLASLSAVAQEPAETYGVIEIGSSGVKASAYHVSIEQARDMLETPSAGAGLRYALFAEHRLVTYQERDVNPYRAENVDRTVRAVNDFMTTMTDRDAIPRDHIFVVASAGLSDVEHAADLGFAIVSETSMPVEFITAHREAALNFDWITPNYRRESALVIDIGSSNVSAGYLRIERTVSGRHEAFELLPTGTKSTLDDVLAVTRGAQPSDLAELLSAYRQTVVEPAYYRVQANHPGLDHRERVYLLGGIVWALAAHQHPHRHGENWPPLESADIAAFRDRIVRGDAFTPDAHAMAEVTDPELRADALAELERVADVFTADQLLAGAELLVALDNRLDLAARDAVFFSRVGRDGWRSQYMLEKIVALHAEPDPVQALVDPQMNETLNTGKT